MRKKVTWAMRYCFNGEEHIIWTPQRRWSHPSVAKLCANVRKEIGMHWTSCSLRACLDIIKTIPLHKLYYCGGAYRLTKTNGRAPEEEFTVLVARSSGGFEFQIRGNNDLLPTWTDGTPVENVHTKDIIEVIYRVVDGVHHLAWAGTLVSGRDFKTFSERAIQHCGTPSHDTDNPDSRDQVVRVLQIIEHHLGKLNENGKIFDDKYLDDFYVGAQRLPSEYGYKFWITKKKNW